MPSKQSTKLTRQEIAVLIGVYTCGISGISFVACIGLDWKLAGAISLYVFIAGVIYLMGCIAILVK